jgi:hypothetical protein
MGAVAALGRVARMAAPATRQVDKTQRPAPVLLCHPEQRIAMSFFNCNAQSRACLGDALNITRWCAWSDGNVWFSEITPSRVGKITPNVVTSYPTLSPNASPWAMAEGSDGNIWFAEAAYGRIAKITPSGTVTEYPVSQRLFSSGRHPRPDGNIWYTVPFTSTGPSIARITPYYLVRTAELQILTAIHCFWPRRQSLVRGLG